MTSLPPREHLQFCSLGLLDTNECVVIGIPACDLLTTGRLLICHANQEGAMIFFILSCL